MTGESLGKLLAMREFWQLARRNALPHTQIHVMGFYRNVKNCPCA